MVADSMFLTTISITAMRSQSTLYDIANISY